LSDDPLLLVRPSLLQENTAHENGTIQPFINAADAVFAESLNAPTKSEI